eukprot:6820861-Pyramimonas_sp.AAC.1
MFLLFCGCGPRPKSREQDRSRCPDCVRSSCHERQQGGKPRRHVAPRPRPRERRPEPRPSARPTLAPSP